MYMAIWSAGFHRDGESLGLSHVLQVATLFALLGGVLLVHPRPYLPGHHLVAAVALPLALGRLYNVLVPCHLQNALGSHHAPSEVAPCWPNPGKTSL